VTDAAADDEIGKLFAVPPAAFVKERDAIVKALKAAGRRDEAASTAKLPRPSASVWAVNQIARQAPALVARLVAATARLQTGEHGNYAGAVAEHREALKSLRFEAERILEAGAIRATPELLARVAHDLRAGVMDVETRSLIERGRLVRDVVEEDSLSPFEQELPPAPPPAPRAAAGKDDRAQEKQKEAAAEAARLAHERRLRELREAVAAAQATSERAEADVDRARHALAEAERRMGAARDAAAKAVAALEAAEQRR